jgi:hypothetical protein
MFHVKHTTARSHDHALLNRLLSFGAFLPLAPAWEQGLTLSAWGLTESAEFPGPAERLQGREQAPSSGPELLVVPSQWNALRRDHLFLKNMSE